MTSSLPGTDVIFVIPAFCNLRFPA